jgi:pimeloyl-ACP methyl ester carboxylesterase
MFVLIHGAGDSAWYWHLVEDELRRRGHEAIAPELPTDDEAAGFADYADAAAAAVGTPAAPLVVVAQSFGAFTAPLICERLPAELLVLVAGLIPAPGETGEDWWANTGYPGHAGGDLFFHDVPPELAAAALAHGREQSESSGREPWPLAEWPGVPTRYLLCRDDRLLPAGWLRGVVRDRLGIEPDEIDGGHCPALSRPAELAERLVGMAERLPGQNAPAND